MKKIKQFILSFLFSIFSMQLVVAHCPLCTAGAAVVGGGALVLGVKTIVVGIFIGAVAVSTGYWLARLVKKQYVPLQKNGIILFSFLLTVIPLLSLPIFSEPYPVYISWFGDYGSLFNRTYVLSSMLLGSIFGGITVIISPWVSKQLANLRKGKKIPFQGTAVTLILLVIAGALLQLVA